MTATANPSLIIGAVYLVQIDGETHQSRAMYTADGTLPWCADDGAIYADETITVLRRLLIVDPEADETSVSDDESAARDQLDKAQDRLQALQRAAEYVRTDAVAPFKLGQTAENAQSRRVIDAAKWVLNG